MAHLVFVFGTLKEGFPNFGVNRGRRLPGAFVTVHAYPLYLVGERRVPWLLDQVHSGRRVRGEVFEVDDAALARMDALERVHEPDGYLRQQIEVVPDTTPPQAPLVVFAYLKRAADFAAWAHDAVGPLGEYSAEHAALYRGRGA